MFNTRNTRLTHRVIFHALFQHDTKKAGHPRHFVLDFAPFSFLHRHVQRALNPLQYLRFPAPPIPFFLQSLFVLEFTPLQPQIVDSDALYARRLGSSVHLMVKVVLGDGEDSVCRADAVQ